MALLMREHSAAYSSFYLYLADSTPFQLLRSPTFSLPLSNEVSSYIYKVIRFFLSHYVFHSRIPWTPKWCFKNLHMLKFISVLWSSLGFDKCIISYIYHHRITRKNFTTLGSLVLHLLNSIPFTHTSGSRRWCPFSMVLPFTEYCILGLRQHVALLDQLLLPSNMYLDSFLFL